MENCIMIGCDLHDENSILKIATGREKPVKMQARNTPAGRGRMIKKLEALSKEAGGAQVIFAYEASGQGFGLYDELTEAGIRCHVLAPTRIPTSNKQRKNKTDEKDAEKILDVLRAHVLAGAELPDVWIPGEETRDDSELVRTRIDIGERITRVKSQIRSLLKRNGKRKPDYTGKNWTKPFRAWLRYLVENKEALRAGASIALDELMRQLEFCEESRDHLNNMLEELSECDRYAKQAKKLIQMSGVGIVTAMTFLTELGDMSRFSNRRQIGAFLGIVPSSSESGESSDRKGHITRQGPWRVRKVLCQAAWSWIRVNAGKNTPYDRIVAKNPKHKKIAVVAVMRRLAIRMWHAALEAGDVVSSEASSPQLLRVI